MYSPLQAFGKMNWFAWMGDLNAKEIGILTNAGVPDATTYANFAGKGSLLVDITNAKLYINGGTKAVPAWKIVTSA